MLPQSSCQVALFFASHGPLVQAATIGALFLALYSCWRGNRLCVQSLEVATGEQRCLIDWPVLAVMMMTEVASVTDAGPSLTLFWLLVFSHLPPFYFPFLFKWSGYQTSSRTTCLKRKRCQGTVKCPVLYSYTFFSAVFVFFGCFSFFVF